MKTYLSAKIHKAIVTQAELNYIGSITIDKDLMDLVGIEHFEKVLVVSNNSGARLETYAIPGEAGSGVICMNGAAAHLIKKGDEIIIMSFVTVDSFVQPKQILVDSQNKFLQNL